LKNSLRKSVIEPAENAAVTRFRLGTAGEIYPEAVFAVHLERWRLKTEDENEQGKGSFALCAIGAPGYCIMHVSWRVFSFYSLFRKTFSAGELSFFPWRRLEDC
jgi:hypothetical protein